MIYEQISSKHHLNAFDVHNYVELYQKLLRILRKINQTLTMQLMAVFFYLYMAATFEIFTIFRSFLKERHLPLWVSFNASIWSIIFILPIYVIVKISEAISEQIERVKEISYVILCLRKIYNLEAERSFDFFLRSVEKSKFQLQTIFFTLDWNLFFKVDF